MIKPFFFCAALLAVTSCLPQNKDRKVALVGGPCEGCEAVFEYGEKVLRESDTLPKFNTSEPRLIIEGTVFHRDGSTPAEGVILYIYHTNRKGIYETRGDEKGWARRHGYIRGWVQTDRDGKYTFFTFRPAAYPDGREPEHIHITVKEPNRNEYYIDEYVFEDDPLLTDMLKNQLENRGGSGVLRLKRKNGILMANRDIILGLNIPGYK